MKSPRGKRYTLCWHSNERVPQDKETELASLAEQQQKMVGLEAERAKRDQALEQVRLMGVVRADCWQAKQEHVERKSQFTDNLLKLRSEIADQKAAVAVQKQEHAAIQAEKEQLRKELSGVNNELKKLKKFSKDIDYAINNDKYGLIQERSNLVVARDKLAEAHDERQFERGPQRPTQTQAFDFNDDSDDLHANFDDLMPSSPSMEFGGQDFDNVNFDIPPGVDKSLFGDSEDDSYDSDDQPDVLTQIAGSNPDSGLAQSPFGGSGDDAWGAFDEPREPSPDPRARQRRAVPHLPIHKMSPESGVLEGSPEYCPFGESPGVAASREDEYQPFA